MKGQPAKTWPIVARIAACLSRPAPASVVAATGGDDLDKARRLIGEGRSSEAESYCRTVLADREDASALQLLGYIAFQTGRPTLAAEACGRAAELGVDDWSNWLALGVGLKAMGRSADARDAFARSNKRSPTRADAAALLLESTVLVDGLDAATLLHAQIGPHVSDGGLARAWRKIQFEAGHDPQTSGSGVVIAPLTTARAWAAAGGRPLREAGTVEAIPIEEPDLSGRVVQSHVTTVVGVAPYVIGISGARIFAKSGMILTPDGVALNEAGGHPEYGRYVSHDADAAVIGQRPGAVLMDIDPFKVRTLERGALLCGPASEAFGHWAAEYLPRLQAFEHHPGFGEIPLIVDDGMPQSHFDHLALIARNHLVRLKPGEGLAVQQLLYAPPPTFFPINLLPNPLPPYLACAASPRAYRFLKTRVEAALGARRMGGAKIYLSRRNTRWRRVRNEAEVESLLRSRGYRTVMVEDLTFKQQVRLFQSASAIVAPNGSSMQNVIFASPEVKLFILSQPNIHNLAAFNGQIKALGYSPSFVIGEAIGDFGEKHVDYVVPLPVLAAALDAVGG